MLWSEENVCIWDERMCENPVMTYPTRKRISTELLIDRTAALYIGETQIRGITYMSSQIVGTRCLSKRCVNERLGVKLS